jgi:lysophospholipase L1-like esterase
LHGPCARRESHWGYDHALYGFGHYHPDAWNEADRQAVNAWIRGKGNFDGIIDFDAITRDPAHPERLLPAYDKGDHLHPDPAGYRAMRQAIALTLFKSGPTGQCKMTLSHSRLRGGFPA